MAFVRYKTTADAVKALEYFHNTFIDTSRVQVEYARAVKSAQLPRPWSKHSEGSSAHRRTHETPEERAAREAKAADAERFIGVRELKKMKRAKKEAFEKEIDDAIAADPKLTEFMRLMAPRSQQRSCPSQHCLPHPVSTLLSAATNRPRSMASRVTITCSVRATQTSGPPPLP